MRGKPERIRDPVHDLIEFARDDFDQTVWDALESKEFQRLRRIKQLGFSELVFQVLLTAALLIASGFFIRPGVFLL